MFKYHLIRLIFKFIFKLIAKIEITGLERYPEREPFIIAINHLTLIDPVILLAILPPRKITVFVAKKWEHKFLVGSLVRALGGIFVHRGEVDRAALQASLKVLRSGGILGLAPEGTRSRTGGLQPAKPGVAYLATKTNTPILPIGISGHTDALQRLRRFRRVKIRVNIGELIYLPPVSGKGKTAQLQAYADRVMIALARLIDPDLRGVYAPMVHSSN